MPISADWVPLRSGKPLSLHARSGVYELANKDQVIIYIGHATNLKDHLPHQSASSPCLRVHAYYYRVEYTDDAKERAGVLLLEFRNRYPYRYFPYCQYS